MKTLYKNTLLITALTLIQYLCVSSLTAQTVGVYNQTIAIAPTNTLVSGASFSVTGSVINTSNVTFSNKIDVNLAIDTSSTSTPKYAWRSTTTYSVTNFTPNQAFSFNVTDVISTPNGYKTNGNGTTVVIWPIIGSASNTLSIHDSAFTQIYIDLTSSINELDIENYLIVQNPAVGFINVEFLDVDNQIITMELFNSQGNCVLTESIITKKTILKTNTFSIGVYYLRFTNTKTNKTITKKIIIN